MRVSRFARGAHTGDNAAYFNTTSTKKRENEIKIKKGSLYTSVGYLLTNIEDLILWANKEFN